MTVAWSTQDLFSRSNHSSQAGSRNTRWQAEIAVLVVSDNRYYVKSTTKSAPASHQSNSYSSSSFTRSLLILRPPGGISKTTNPFTMRVGVAHAAPFRTNSEAALPSVRECVCEYCRRTSIALSSRFNVMRMVRMNAMSSTLSPKTDAKPEEAPRRTPTSCNGPDPRRSALPATCATLRPWRDPTCSLPASNS
jgi:hypothetical protein